MEVVILKKTAFITVAVLLLLLMAACSANKSSTETAVPSNQNNEASAGVDNAEAPEEHAAGHDEAADSNKAADDSSDIADMEPKEDEPNKDEAKAEPEPATEPETHKVEIVGFAFAPAALEINAGDKVQFINLDQVQHTATENNGLFDTGLLAEGESETVTFDNTGEFGYFCTPHPGMKAAIIVK